MMRFSLYGWFCLEAAQIKNARRLVNKTETLNKNTCKHVSSNLNIYGKSEATLLLVYPKEFPYFIQLNEITPFLDGQVIYGPSRAWTDAIRELKGGRLAGTNPGNIPQSFPFNNDIRLPYANPPVAREHVLKPVTRFHSKYAIRRI